MKKIFTLLIAFFAFFSCIAQTNTAEVVRTLDLRSSMSIYNTHLTRSQTTYDIVICDSIDFTLPKNKEKLPNGKWRTWNDTVKMVLTTSSTVEKSIYLPNLLSTRLRPESKMYIVSENASNYQLKKDHIKPNGASNWIGAQWITITPKGNSYLWAEWVEPGMNVLPANAVDIYGKKLPKGNTSESDPYVPITYQARTRTSNGKHTIGSWYRFILLSDLIKRTGMTADEIGYAKRWEFNCVQVNPQTHITAVSTEIIRNGTTFNGITYYSGINAGTNPPLKKIPSYGEYMGVKKEYPGHVVRWLFKPTDGSAKGNRGESVGVQFTASESHQINVVKGTTNSWNPSTRTLTYDRVGYLWYEMEEAQAQGKNQSWESVTYLE